MVLYIDENCPDLSGIPDFLFARFFFSGYGHRHISGSPNSIKNIFRIFFCQAILIYGERSLDLSLMGFFNCFLFQSVIHNWCNKGHGMYYPVCEMRHIKEPLLLIRKSSPCSCGSKIPLSLYLIGP